MNAFHGNPQLKQRLEARANMLGQDYSTGLRNLKPGEYAWQVRRHIMPLVPLPDTAIIIGDEAEITALNNSYGSTIDVPAPVLFTEHALFDELHESAGVWWPLRFARAVAVGADLSPVWRELAL